MMDLKIATWNVNSLRVRLPHLLKWLAEVQPDVIVLQETKLEDKDFPLAEVIQAGYQVIFCGQKTYNGVAILSRTPAQEVVTAIPMLLDDPQRRVLVATINDIRIINLYVPNGESISSNKYRYKLDWLSKVAVYVKEQLACYPKLVVLGDFNIALEDRDIHDPQIWKDQVLASVPERQALQTLMAAGLQDSFRLFEANAGHYSWWDYRAAAFRRNLGLRIDHILISQLLVKECSGCVIDKAPRSWERPSDHAPVIASFMRKIL